MTATETRSPRLRVYRLQAEASRAMNALDAADIEARVHGVVAWRELPYYTPRERAALALTEAITLIANGVPDDVYAEAERQFEPAELAGVIWTIVTINAWNRLAIPTGDPVPGSYE